MKSTRAGRLLIRAKPYPDESCTGYFLRLTEQNGYESLSWIFQAADVSYEKSHQGCVFAFDASKHLSHLAQLAGISTAEIIKLTYPRTSDSDNLSLNYFFGQPVSKDLIRSNRPKICPGCLSETPYCRRVWEFSAVTACPIHRRLLIDECPKCNRRISWFRKSVRVCSCKFDWRESPALPVVEQELRLTRHIYQLCGLSVAVLDRQKLSEPIAKLSLNDLLRALLFVAGQQRGLSSSTSRHLVAAGKNQNFHNILIKTYSVFECWPDNYFRFLDQRRLQEKSVVRTYQRMKSALYGEFGSFYSGLHSVLSEKQFDFMRCAFIEYLTRNWVRVGHLNSMHQKTIEDSPKEPYVLKSDVRRLLGVDNTWINHRINTGALTTMTLSKGKKRLIFIKVIDVLGLADKR